MIQTARIVPVLLLLSVLVPGCNQNDLGRYCFVGAEGGDNSSGSLTFLNPEAPECGERLCLKQGGYKCSDDSENCSSSQDLQEKINPMCTKECSDNSDCKGSEENVNGCTKYVCQRQGTETGFGDHCICVCLNYIRNESGSEIDLETFNSEANYAACKQ